MQRRILLIAIVFVAGFGIGYGITWIFVGSSDRPDASRIAEGGTDGRTDGRNDGRVGRDREQPVAAANIASDKVADATVAAGIEAEVAGEPVAVAGADTNAPAEADARVEGDAAAPPPVAPDVVAAVPKPAEWERCLNRVCRIDFGGVSGGISVRKGKLDHGKEVVWDREFGRADKVGTLDSGRNVRVEVLGIGLTNGEPSAAYISRKVRRGTQTGVVALRIGERKLSLVPTDD